jgi:uncharacterized protein
MQDKPPKIEFPCDYPIKIIGEASPDYTNEVLRIVNRYDAKCTLANSTLRPSRNGKYESLTINFWALNEQQIASMFAELKQVKAVRMVL